jgi:hypothetical protein
MISECAQVTCVEQSMCKNHWLYLPVVLKERRMKT